MKYTMKYKVGDKVKVIANNLIGTVIYVSAHMLNSDYAIKLDQCENSFLYCNIIYVSEEELELISKASQAIPEGYYKIGDRVSIDTSENKQSFGHVVAYLDENEDGGYVIDSKCVHKIPAWIPKEGESVLVAIENKECGNRLYYWSPGVYSKGLILGFANAIGYNSKSVIPFDASKIGKPVEYI